MRISSARSTDHKLAIRISQDHRLHFIQPPPLRLPGRPSVLPSCGVAIPSSPTVPSAALRSIRLTHTVSRVGMLSNGMFPVSPTGWMGMVVSRHFSPKSTSTLATRLDKIKATHQHGVWWLIVIAKHEFRVWPWLESARECSVRRYCTIASSWHVQSTLVSSVVCIDDLATAAY